VTLRLRLVLAISLLVTVGLSIFGVVTYSLYSRSQYDRLDEQLRASLPIVEAQLAARSGTGSSQGGFGPPSSSGADNNGYDRGSGGPNGRPGPPVVVNPNIYAELQDANGAVIDNATLRLSDSDSAPSIPSPLPSNDQTFTTGPATGSGDWRVLVSPTDRPRGATAVVAVPLTEVSESLYRLVLIEVAAGIGLLALIASGSWLILRAGLLPLEHMATSARSISAGDLSERVEPAEDTTEVGQLGLALNTMLDEIQAAFVERDATEHRLRQFLADASHELRTPLTSIQGFAELYRLGGDHEHVDLDVILRRIEEESARMKVLVEDLLLLARLDETRPVEREPVDLAVLAADACSDAVATAPDRPVTLDAPQPVVVPGDRDHLRQAIANLVANAVAHTPDGSAIDVGARLEDGAAIVSVRDRGPGLDDDALAHVFDRFWQADVARVGSGAGLGLAIVAGIAAEHSGTVAVANCNDGGAEFTVRLPINAADPGQPPSENPAPRKL
jgi:two-component system OmpR family sensor kinase